MRKVISFSASLFALALSALPVFAHGADSALDYWSVLQLSSKYAWGIDSHDHALLATVFTKDATAHYLTVTESPIQFDQKLVGFDNIYAWLEKNLGHRKGYAGLPWHYVTNQIVTLHGDRAEMRFYMHNRPMAAGGTYFIKAVRTPDGWRVEDLRLEEQIWKPETYSNTTVAK